MLTIPTTCPICSSTLERVNDQLFCRNNSCDAKSSKKIQHFVKVMKIKGLGEKTLEKLELSDITQLYDLSKEELISTLGEKIGTKIFNEIAQSKEVPLATFIQSFGIPLIGNSAATKVAKVTESLWNVDDSLCKDAGLGQKASDNLVNWVQANKALYDGLPISFTALPKALQVESQGKVCITGKLSDFSSRAKAKEFLESNGVSVVGTVSSKIDYLISDQGDTGSSSCSKANQLNIPIITMNDLLTKLNIKEII